MNLESIGFYTLSNARCENLSGTSPMARGEIVLTDRCNFKCPYCRGLPNHKGDMPTAKVIETLTEWVRYGLEALRFTGGEPLAWWGKLGESLGSLNNVVRYARNIGVKHIAVSTNGSYPLNHYLSLIQNGVNDYSISLDACCAALGDKMAGITGQWTQVVNNIRELSRRVYTVVGIVVTETNVDQLVETIQLAHDLGVADIKLMPAAQCGLVLTEVRNIPESILAAHPVLRYRVHNMLAGRGMRGIGNSDACRCYLPIDDSTVCGEDHFPCLIYLRERGKPIGKVGPNMRAERILWAETHDTHADPICRKNCPDWSVNHNNCIACRRGELQ